MGATLMSESAYCSTGNIFDYVEVQKAHRDFVHIPHFMVDCILMVSHDIFHGHDYKCFPSGSTSSCSMVLRKKTLSV